jgi:hypothetical protein
VRAVDDRRQPRFAGVAHDRGDGQHERRVRRDVADEDGAGPLGRVREELIDDLVVVRDR